MNSDINSIASEASLGKFKPLLADSTLDALMIVIVIGIIAGLTSLYLSSSASGRSVTVRCEQSAVIAAGDKKNFRKERKLAFERCMDESLQTTSQPVNSKISTPPK